MVTSLRAKPTYRQEPLALADHTERHALPSATHLAYQLFDADHDVARNVGGRKVLTFKCRRDQETECRYIVPRLLEFQ